MVRIQLLGHQRASIRTHLVDGQLAIIPSILRRKNNYTGLTICLRTGNQARHDGGSGGEVSRGRKAEGAQDGAFLNLKKFFFFFLNETSVVRFSEK